MSRSVRFIVMAIVLLGVVLSVLVPWRFRVLERRELTAEFRREVDARTVALDREIGLNLEVLYALKCFFMGSQRVEPGEFSLVASQALKRHAGIEVLTWVPCAVEKRQRILEVSRHADQVAFKVHEMVVQGRSAVAGPGDCLLTGFSPEHKAQSAPFLGLDLASDAKFLQLLRNARDDGDVRIFEWPDHFGSAKGRQRFLALLPVYSDTAAGISERRDNLRGFVLGIFDYATIFEQAGWGAFPTLSAVRLVDLSSAGRARELYSFYRDQGLSWTDSFSYERAVTVGGATHWQVQATPVRGYFGSNLSMTPWLFVLVGLLLTSMAPFYLWLTTKHTAFVEEQVAHRTRALDEANRKLASLSLTDGLTGIANRRYFDDHLKLEWNRAVREGHPLSLIMVDIDHFKAYNDHYGHLAGDDCLRQVAGVLKNIASRPGDLVARYGGEEFALILPQTENGAKILGERCRAKVEGCEIPHHASPVKPVVTVSVGVASIVPKRGMDPAILIQIADQALYRAKLLGRNHVVIEMVVSQECAISGQGA